VWKPGYIVNQTWLGYTIDDRTKYYASVIQKLLKELGFPSLDIDEAIKK